MSKDVKVSNKKTRKICNFTVDNNKFCLVSKNTNKESFRYFTKKGCPIGEMLKRSKKTRQTDLVKEKKETLTR